MEDFDTKQFKMIFTYITNNFNEETIIFLSFVIIKLFAEKLTNYSTLVVQEIIGKLLSSCK